MAELPMGKGVSAGRIASNVQKKITRAQEKVRHFNHRIYIKYIISFDTDLSYLPYITIISKAVSIVLYSVM